MTTNTEALREQFELYVNPEGDIKLHRLVDGSYAGHGLNQSWMDFQAGPAAGVAAGRGRSQIWPPICQLMRAFSAEGHSPCLPCANLTQTRPNKRRVRRGRLR